MVQQRSGRRGEIYTSIFENSGINRVTPYRDTGPGAKGIVMTVSFTLAGQPFTALNAGPRFKFTEAISFVVNCDTQDEIDNFWTKLSAGGTEVQCGWLRDKYGLSWQVVPAILGELFNDKHPEKAQRAIEALLQMKARHCRTAASLRQPIENLSLTQIVEPRPRDMLP